MTVVHVQRYVVRTKNFITLQTWHAPFYALTSKRLIDSRHRSRAGLAIPNLLRTDRFHLNHQDTYFVLPYTRPPHLPNHRDCHILCSVLHCLTVTPQFGKPQYLHVVCSALAIPLSCSKVRKLHTPHNPRLHGLAVDAGHVRSVFKYAPKVPKVRDCPPVLGLIFFETSDQNVRRADRGIQKDKGK